MKIKQMSPQLLVADLERSLDFYTTHLGYELDFLYEDLMPVSAMRGIAYISNRANRDKVARMNTLTCIFRSKLLKHFSKISRAGRLTSYNPYGKEFYITDPDGYILGFIENE
jgi:predicted enzyme related to lactoylglutathione lyase